MTPREKFKEVEFLGETAIDTTTHPEFKDKDKVEWALEYIRAYGQIDGDHHKQWVLDQVARILLGTPVVVTEAKWSDGKSEFRDQTGEPSEEYTVWVEGCKAGEDGPETYDYDEGIAP